MMSSRARFPDPFEPKIARTSPPCTLAETSFKTAVGSDLERQFLSIRTDVVW